MGPLLGLMMVAAAALAGGDDPRMVPVEEPVKYEKVQATPAQTSAAVSKARRAVAPVVEKVPVAKAKAAPVARTKSAPAANKDSWLLGSPDKACAPLSSVSSKVKNIGSFETPQEFARKMQQRGYQAFVLDIGDVREQLVRVKVPDLELDLTFVKAGLCR